MWESQTLHRNKSRTQNTNISDDTQIGSCLWSTWYINELRTLQTNESRTPRRRWIWSLRECTPWHNVFPRQRAEALDNRCSSSVWQCVTHAYVEFVNHLCVEFVTTWYITTRWSTWQQVQPQCVTGCDSCVRGVRDSIMCRLDNKCSPSVWQCVTHVYVEFVTHSCVEFVTRWFM